MTTAFSIHDHNKLISRYKRMHTEWSLTKQPALAGRLRDMWNEISRQKEVYKDLQRKRMAR